MCEANPLCSQQGKKRRRRLIPENRSRPTDLRLQQAVFAVSSSDGISFGGGYDFASTRAVYPWRWAAGWTTLSTSAHADIREMAVEGTWGPGPAQPHGIGVGGNHLTTRGNGLLATLLAAHAGLDWWIIYGAFRSGVSSGSESVTVDITSDLLQRVR